jgi:molybdopterin molybdotransferase
MGEKDVMAPALEAAGVRFVFRDVAMKPGKPFAFGLLGSMPVFALPGNPVSVLCTFEELVLPGLRRLAGFQDARKARHLGISGFAHKQKPGRTNLLRVSARTCTAGWGLEMPPSSGSGDLRSTRDTNALAIVPGTEAGVEPGQKLLFSFYASSLMDTCFG